MSVTDKFRSHYEPNMLRRFLARPVNKSEYRISLLFLTQLTVKRLWYLPLRLVRGRSFELSI